MRIAFRARAPELTPHIDKKLDPAVRTWLESRLPVWEKSAAEAKSPADPKTQAKAKEVGQDKGTTGTPPSRK